MSDEYENAIPLNSLRTRMDGYLDDSVQPPVTSQPERNEEYPGNRRPIPISTIDWQSNNELRYAVADNGADFLRGVEQVNIQQTVELNNLSNSSIINSVNRYKVFVPNGETLYYASEESDETERMCCGSNRSFIMFLNDPTDQEAIVMKRNMGCGCCSFWCYPNKLEVWLSPDLLVGAIQQHFSFTVPKFTVINDHNTVVYRIEGPASFGCFNSGKEAHFKIYSADGLTQLGSINHQWDQVKCDYNLGVYFPNRRDHPKNKALLLGAAFLLEYMYFVNGK